MSYSRIFRDFKDEFDLVSYINKKNHINDIDVIKAARNDLANRRKELEARILEEFIKNEDHFMSVLSKYSSVAGFKKEIKKNLSVYKKIIARIREKDNIVIVDSRKREELIKQFAKFEEDMSLFATDRRYLIDSVNVQIDHNGEKENGLILLSNDFLFVGIGTENGYRLLNVFAYSLVSIEMADAHLSLTVDPVKINIYGDQRVLDRIYTTWQEQTYDMEKSRDSAIRDTNTEYENYLIETNRFVPGKTEHFKIRTHEDFMAVLQAKDRDMIAKFFLERFIEQIDTTHDNDLSTMIENVFAIFTGFFDEEKELLKDTELASHLPVVAEAQIITLLKFLEPRIFWKRRLIDNMSDVVEKIKGHLKWKGYDYTYVISIYDEKMSKHEKTRLEMAKTKIFKIINETDTT